MIELDNLSPENRRKNMQAIKSTHTALETQVSRELWTRGLRFRRNVKALTGKPDIAIKKYRIAVFIDSCFWHGCPEHGKMPSSNTEYWEAKINRNRARDVEVTNYYVQRGWHLLRIWEHDFRHDFDETINRIVAFVMDIKGRHGT